MHYMRWYKRGSVDLPPSSRTHQRGYCAVDGCGNLTDARGWCKKHYARWRKYGDLEAKARTGRLCSICLHADVDDIEAEMRRTRRGRPRRMNPSWSVSDNAWRRHKRLHLDNVGHAESLANSAISNLQSVYWTDVRTGRTRGS